MSDLFPEQKIYKNGNTYAQNVKEGFFIPIKHIKNHQEVCQRIDKLEQMLVSISEKLSAK
mgnify:CR=1 FL=1|jgi:hypothetical protein|tara:strand:+ start:689 stop:868 length:180 start_codon:yes stop_codon:yes gene_type:complete